MRKLISILFAFLLFAGAAVTYAAEGDQTGKYYTIHQEKKMGQPTANRALVYIIRPQFLGTAIKFWSFMDNHFLAVTRGKKYSYALVRPGMHVFWAKAENVNAIRINVKPGKTYYLYHKVKMGGFRAGVQLRVVNEDEAMKMIKKSKFVTPTGFAVEKAKKYLEKFYPQAKQAASNYPESKIGKTFEYPDDE